MFLHVLSVGHVKGGFEIWHTGVRQLHCVFVEDFFQLVVGGKAGFQYFVKFSADVCFYTGIEWGIEPGDFSCSFPLFLVVFLSWFVSELEIVPTISECFLVLRDASFENFLIR